MTHTRHIFLIHILLHLNTHTYTCTYTYLIAVFSADGGMLPSPSKIQVRHVLLDMDITYCIYTHLGQHFFISNCLFTIFCAALGNKMQISNCQLHVSTTICTRSLQKVIHYLFTSTKATTTK